MNNRQTFNLMTLKGLLHDQTKFHRLLLKPGFVKPKPSVQCLSWGREGVRLSSNTARRDGMFHLGTYAAAVVIITFKMTANPYEVIAEAGMQWKYILLPSQSSMSYV